MAEISPSKDKNLEDAVANRKFHKDKSGLVYLSSVPPGFTAREIRHVFSSCGEVGRIFLKKKPDKLGTVKKPRKTRFKKAFRYEEGWVEFKKKKVAKKVAAFYNGKQVGGKKKSEAYDSIWCIKYLHRFKWENLDERLSYERALYAQRRRVEIERAKHESEHFMKSVNNVGDNQEDGSEVVKFNQRLTSNELKLKKTKRAKIEDGLKADENPGESKSLLQYIFT